MKRSAILLSLIILPAVLCSCGKEPASKNTAAVVTSSCETSSVASLAVSSAVTSSAAPQSSTAVTNKPVVTSKPTVKNKPAVSKTPVKPKTSSSNVTSSYPALPALKPLTATQIAEIKQAWLSIELQNKNKFVKTVGDLWIPGYYGTYDNAIVIEDIQYKAQISTCQVTYYKIAGYDFVSYNGLDYLSVYKNSKFYGLSYAYDHGIVSKRAIADIWYYRETGKGLRDFDDFGK